MKTLFFALFVFLFVGRNLLEPTIQPSGAKGRRTNIRGESFSLSIMVGFYFLSGMAVGFFLYKDAVINIPLYWSGLFLFVASFAGRIMGIRQLGGSYSQQFAPPHNSQLITAGLYQIVRHPLYLFYLLELGAFLLIRFNLLSAVSFVTVLIVTVYRIEKEERSLIKTFGESYQIYKERTKALIPFVI